MNNPYIKSVIKTVRDIEKILNLNSYDFFVSVNLTDDTTLHFNELKNTATLETYITSILLEAIDELGTLLCCNLEEGYLKATTQIDHIDLIFCYDFALTSNIEENLNQFQISLKDICDSIHKVQSLINNVRDTPQMEDQESFDIENLRNSINNIFKENQEKKGEEDDKSDEIKEEEE